MKKAFSLIMMLTILMTSIPMAFAEEISVIIPDESWGTWKKVSSKRYSFTFEVKNTHSSNTVRSFDVTYYTCDAYGQQNAPTETVTLTQKIKPYETIVSDIIYLSNPQDSCLVYVAITGAYYTNGTREKVSEPSYCYWVLNEEDLMVDPADITTGATTSPTEAPASLSGDAVHLTIPERSEASLKKVSSKRLSIRFEIKNTHPTKTITSYDITYYTCDQYGSQNSAYEKVTLTQKIKPYETVTCPEIFLENATYVYSANFAVTRVRYSDGTTETTSSPVYSGWYWDW